MRILYSNDSIQYMLRMDEKPLTKLIDSIKGSVKGNAGIKTIPIKGSKDHKRLVVSGSNYALLKNKKFKGKEIVYVVKILDQEDVEYIDASLF